MGNQQGYLNDANTHKHPIDGAFFAPNCLIRFGGSAQQGWRSYMEDTISIYDTDFQETGLLMFIVFDGHGGARTAQFCASNLAPFLARVIKRNNCVITQQLLSDAILEFDWSLCLTPGEAMKHMSCGTTMTLLILDTIRSKVHLAHLGDSRGIIFRSSGHLVHVTRDHNPQQPEELARILPLTAPHMSVENPFTRISLQANRVLVGDCSSLNVCRTLGDHDFKRVAGVAQIAQPVCAVIEYFEMSFAEYHADTNNNNGSGNGANNQQNPPKLCFFLASDGIWNGSITPMFQKPADPAVASASSSPAAPAPSPSPATPSKSNKKQPQSNSQKVVNSPIFYQKTAAPPDTLSPPDSQSGSPSPVPSPGRGSTPVRSVTGSLAERAFSSPLMLSPPTSVSMPESSTPLLSLPENGTSGETKEPFLPMSPVPSPGGNAAAQMGLASPSARRGVHHNEILQHRPPPPPRAISRWDWLHGKHPNEQVVHWLMLDTMRCAHYSTSISRLFDNIIAKRNPQLGKSNDNMAAILITIEPFDFGQPHILPGGSDEVVLSSPIVVESESDPALSTALDRKLTLHRDDTLLQGKLLKIIRAAEDENASAPV